MGHTTTVSKLTARVQGVTSAVTFKVLIDSSIAAGVIVHSMEVFAFPPSDDCNIRVSFESRNGIKLPRNRFVISRDPG